MLEKAKAAISKAKAEFPVSHIFFVWLQGESDAIHSRSKAEYKEKLSKLGEILRDELSVEKFGIIRVVVERRNDYLTQSRGDALLLEAGEKCERGIDRAPDVLAVESVGRVFDVEQHSVCHVEQSFDLFGQDASRCVEAGVNSVAVAQNKKFLCKFRLQKRFTA